MAVPTTDFAEDFIGDAVKDTDRNRRHYKEIDQKSLCMSATMYKGAGNNGMTLVPRPCELKEFNKDSTCHHVATATDIKTITILDLCIAFLGGLFNN